MVGDIQDMTARLRLVLPSRWFSDTAPLRDAFLGALGTAWSAIYDLIVTVRAQTRLSTASGSFLDQAAADFFGSALLRRAAESDTSFFGRVEQELLRPRATRSALDLVLTELTGRSPVLFEPARPEDTGGYSTYGLGYCVAGAWGSLELPFQVFVTAYRPRGGGIAAFAGYGTAGTPAYGNLDIVSSEVSDSDIISATTGGLPVGTIAWLRISD